MALVFTGVTQITLSLFGTQFSIVVLAVYVDDILLIDSASSGLLKTKEYLKHHFVTKDMGKSKYFLGIKITYQKHNVLLSKRKYALDPMKER